MGIPDRQLSFSRRSLGGTVFRFRPRKRAAEEWRRYRIQADCKDRRAARSLAGDGRLLSAHLRSGTLVSVLEVVCAHPLDQSDVAWLMAADRVQRCSGPLLLCMADGGPTCLAVFQSSETAELSAFA